MKIELTKGMLGEVVEEIADNVVDLQSANDICNAWKKANKDNYKIEPYCRMIFHSNEKTVVVDFGDYSYFIAIRCNNDNEWQNVSQ